MENQAALTGLIMIGLIIAVIVRLATSDKKAHESTVDYDSGERRRVAKVKHVIDGDTAIVVIGWQEITLRLDGIDCPECDQHWGDIAKYGLIKMIGGRKIRFEQHGLDNYKRTLATIFVLHDDGKTWTDVNTRMVLLGHAWVSRLRCQRISGDRQSELLRLEQWARTKRVGLWKFANPVPPWEWRRS